MHVTLATTSDVRGGVSRHIQDLAGALAARGHDVTVSAPESAHWLQSWCEQHQHHWRAINHRPGDGGKDQVWHIHLGDTFDLAAAKAILLARAAGYRVVVTEHLPRTNASDPSIGNSRTLRRRLAIVAKAVFKKAEFSLCHSIVTVSESSRDFLRSRYRLKAPVHAVYNGIDIPPPVIGRRAPDRNGMVISIGALIRQKGHDVLVEAASAPTDWRARVVGVGPHQLSLARASAETSAGRVEFPGWTDDVRSELINADVFCMPSRWEAFGYACLEAMSLGLPVVVTSGDGLAELVTDGVQGRVVPSEDPQALRAAIDEILTDTSAYLDMSAAARERACEFTIDRMASGLETVYRGLVRRPDASGSAESAKSAESAGSAESVAMLVARPQRGGIAHVGAQVVKHARHQGLETVDVVVPRGTVPALSGLSAAWRQRSALRNARRVHVELGRLSTEVYWFLALTCFFRSDVHVVAHDVPVVVKNPGAALLPSRDGLLDILAYRLVSPVIDPLLRRWVRSRVAGWGVLGDRALTRCSAMGLSPAVRIHHGADPQARLVSPSAGSHVLFAGFLGPGKGLEDLLEAWRVVGAELPVGLLIAGTHVDRQSELWADELRARYAGIPNAPVWAGALNDEQFDDAFAHAAVVVLPYKVSNPASGILLRAASHGRPVITTRMDAAACCVVGCSAGVVIDSAAELGPELTRLLGNPRLLDTMGAAGKSHARADHTWQRHLADVQQLHQLTRRSSR